MKRYLFTASVTSAEGTQTFYIDAESQEEANDRAEAGETDGMYSSEVEVTDLGHMDADGETVVDDFGDFPPDTTKDQKDESAD